MGKTHDYFPMYREYKTFATFVAFCLGIFAVPVSGSEDVGADSVAVVVGAAVAEPSLPSPPLPSPSSSSPLHLSVDDVIERVKSLNLDLLIRKEGVQRALAQSYQRRAALLPQFSARAQQTRQQLARGFTSEQFDAPPFNSFGSRIEASVSVFDTRHYAEFKIAQLNYTIEQMDYAVATQDILEQAIMLYFTHLRDLQSVEIALANLKREQELLDLAQQQFDAGAAIRIDVTRAEVRMAVERRALMEAEISVEDSIMALKALLDLDLDQALELDRGVIEALNAPLSAQDYSSMEVLTELRPELQSQQKSLSQAELAKRAVGWQRLPTVELFADWGYDTSRVFDGEEGEAWLVGLRATMPIWEGGRIAAEKREATSAVRQNEYQMRNLRNRIEREFKFSMLEMGSRYAQINIATDEIRLGHDEVDQARERYQEGLGDNLELIEAQIRLAEAERSHLRAVYLYGLSRLAFVRSIGSVERILE
jgi:outer membrane protein TolC